MDLDARHKQLPRPEGGAGLGYREEVPQARGDAADQHDVAADLVGGDRPAAEHILEVPEVEAADPVKGQHLLVPGGIQLVVAPRGRIQPGARFAALLESLPQPALALAHLQQAQGQGDGGFVLPRHMHQIAADHPVGIQHQIVEAASIGRGARNRTNGLGHVEDRDEARIVAEALPQAGLVGAHPLVAVDVEADRHRPLVQQPVDRLAEHLVVDGEPVGGEVRFVDADDRDRLVRARRRRTQAGDQVIEQQVEGLVDWAALQRQQQQAGGGVGDERAQAVPQVQGPQPGQPGRRPAAGWCASVHQLPLKA